MVSDQRWICGLFVGCLLLVLVGSASQAKDEKQAVLEEKVRKLTEWATKDGVISLTYDKFTKYLRRAPRNYSVIVMLTALKAERQCLICSAANEEFQMLGPYWQKDLFFAMVDYDSAPSVFQDLQLSTAPVFMHFPPKGKRKDADTMKSMREFKAEDIAAWVEERTGVKVRVFRPIYYVYIGGAVAGVVVAAILLYCLQDSLHLIFNKYVMAVSVVTLIFTFISGHMWNRIRQPPNMFKNPRTGEMMYIHPQRGSQFVMESYIIMMLHGSMLAGFIMMNEIGNLKWKWAKIIVALAGLICFIGFFILLLSVFKMKSPYYPYGFFDLLNDYVWKMK